MKRNRYSRALRHLKSTELDEKIQRLNETPTNNMSGVYSLNDPGFRLGGINDQDPERVFYADVDGNWAAGVPGTPGEFKYTRPRGYWDYGPGTVPAVETIATQDFMTVDGVNGTNTDRFIRSSDGFVLADLPPNTRNFILGPLVDAYVLNHGVSIITPQGSDYTNIGYIQKDTRQFVLLGKIQGTWTAKQAVEVDIGFGLYKSRVWDGSASGFTSYNANFTLEHALWFREKMIKGDFTPSVPYKYSGAVPQEPDPINPGFVNGNVPDKGRRGGSNDSQGTKQKNPKKGGPGDASLWGLNYKTGKKEKLSAKDYAAYKAGGGDAAAKKGKSIKDIIAQGNKNLYDKYLKSLPPGVRNDMLKGGKTSSPVGDAALTLAIAAGLRGGVSAAKYVANASKPATGLARGTKGVQVGATGLKKPGFEALKNAENLHKGSKGLLSPGGKGVYSAPKVGQVGPGGLSPGSGAARYSRAGSNPVGGVQGKSGQPGGVVGSVTPGGARGTNFIEPQKVVKPQEFQKGQQLFQKIQSGQYPNSALANKLRQQAGQAGFKPGQTNVPYNQLPTAPASSGAGQNALKGAAAIGALNAGQAKGQVVPQLPADLKTKIDKGETLTNKDFDALKQYMDAQKSQGQKPQQVDSLSKISNASSPEAKSVADQLSNVKPGSSKESSLKKQAAKLIDKLSPNDPSYNKLLNLLAPTPFSGIKESSILTEDHRRILREIKQPIKYEEPPVQKLKKYKPNFAGKYTAQNTPDVTASKQSDDMVAAKNAAGQSWKAEDKYWKGYETTERMNIIYDQVGHGDQAWNMVMDEIQNKRRWMNRDIQEKLNIIAHEKAMRKEDPDYESPFMNIIKEQETLKADKDPLFKKVSKRLKTEIDYPDKPSKLGYPNDPPPKMIDGWHPDYGQKDDYYNKLDPDSANSMPSTGNADIDAKVKRAKTLKKVLGKKA